MDQASHPFLGVPTLAWIPLLPLLGAFFNLVFGRWLSKTTVTAIALGAVGGAFLVAAWHVFGPLLSLFHEERGGVGIFQVAYTWIEVPAAGAVASENEPSNFVRVSPTRVRAPPNAPE